MEEIKTKQTEEIKSEKAETTVIKPLDGTSSVAFEKMKKKLVVILLVRVIL